MSKWTDEAKKYSNTMARQLLVGAKYVPEDKYDWCPGGVAKTATKILDECVLVNKAVAGVLRGENPGEESYGHGSQQAAGYDKAKDLIEASCAELCAAIDLWAAKDLTQELPMPWGMNMTAEAVIFLAGSHMDYHNGQLNYIQSLLGDGEMHWE